MKLLGSLSQEVGETIRLSVRVHRGRFAFLCVLAWLKVKSEQGFSLIEVMIVVAIFGILAAMGVSNYPELAEGVTRANARQQFEFDVRRARASASSEGAIAVLEIGMGGDSYSVGLDYAPFAAPPAPDEVLFTRELDSSITIGASDDDLL